MTRPLPATRALTQQTRRLRIHHGMSCRALAEAITKAGYQISRNQLQKYENHTPQTVPVDFAAAAAQALNVPLDDLVNPGPCRTCNNQPADGFTCNLCGLGQPPMHDIRQAVQRSRSHP